MSHKLLQKEIFSDIYNSHNKKNLAIAHLFFENNAEQIVNDFYSKLNSFAETEEFLTTDLVEMRLKRSLTEWLVSISDLALNNDFSVYFEKQQLIGKVHARIRVPVYLVNYGVDRLKQLAFQLLQKEKLECKEKLIVVNLVSRSIDLAVMLFNDAYFRNSIKQEKNEQNLRQHYISNNLAMEFEQSRADLLHWQRELLTSLFYPYSKIKMPKITLLSQSKFGLWVEHRAAVLCYSENAVKKLIKNLYLGDDIVKGVVRLNQQENWEQLADKVTELDNIVIATDWLLDQVAKDIAALENNKDPLTKMFTRRYLPNIIQHEIHYCLEHNVSLGLIMIDIDHFKKINDQYGHTVGDTVLSKTAGIISRSIRAYDYVFRYGGEEFLVLINNTNKKDCVSVAEEIKSRVASYQFKDLPFIEEAITISLGVAIFNKHPDYEQLINQADRALYIAKEKGRNRVEFYSE